MGAYTSQNKEIKYRISQNIESQELTKYEQIGTCLNLQELICSIQLPVPIIGIFIVLQTI